MTTFNPNDTFHYCKYSGIYSKRIKLTPDYELSIIYGELTQSNDKECFEIALYKDRKRLYLTEYDTVEGYVTADRINDFIKLVQNTKDENEILQYFR